MAKGHDRQARHAAYRSLAFSRSAVASLAGGIPKRDFHATEHRGLPAAARTVALHLRVEAGIRVEARTRSKRTRSARRLWGLAGSRIRRECGRERLRRPRSWLSSNAVARPTVTRALELGAKAGAWRLAFRAYEVLRPAIQMRARSAKQVSGPGRHVLPVILDSGTPGWRYCLQRRSRLRDDRTRLPARTKQAIASAARGIATSASPGVAAGSPAPTCGSAFSVIRTPAVHERHLYCDSA